MNYRILYGRLYIIGLTKVSFNGHLFRSALTRTVYRYTFFFFLFIINILNFHREKYEVRIHSINRCQLSLYNDGSETIRNNFTRKLFIVFNSPIAQRINILFIYNNNSQTTAVILVLVHIYVTLYNMYLNNIIYRAHYDKYIYKRILPHSHFYLFFGVKAVFLA